jgi:hypothetical protein
MRRTRPSASSPIRFHCGRGSLPREASWLPGYGRLHQKSVAKAATRPILRPRPTASVPLNEAVPQAVGVEPASFDSDQSHQTWLKRYAVADVRSRPAHVLNLSIRDAYRIQRVARMARFGVRSGSLAFARTDEHAASKRFERTGANGCEHRWLSPCRRSWVRVPSSAPQTPGNRGFFFWGRTT